MPKFYHSEGAPRAQGERDGKKLEDGQGYGLLNPGLNSTIVKALQELEVKAMVTSIRR
jgi:hypothetical protein